MHLIKQFSFLLMCFLMSILLCACGSKGELYQVDEPEAEQKTTQDEPQQRNEETKKKPL